jgi:glucose/arabinose dehydrogenase
MKNIADISGLLKATLLTHAFPKDEHHGWKYIQFGPDDLMYIPVGCPCNVTHDLLSLPSFASGGT